MILSHRNPRRRPAANRSRGLRTLGILLAASTAIAPGPDPEQENAAPPIPWRPGEVLEFTVTLGVLPEAARVRLETLAPVPAGRRDALRLLAEVDSGPLLEPIVPFHHRLLSSVTLPGFLPVEASRQLQEGEVREFRALTYHRNEGEVDQAARAGGEPVRTVPIQDDTRDVTSALYHIRSLPAGRGDRFTVFEAGRLYRVDVGTEEPGSLTVPAGTFPAQRLRIAAQRIGGERPVRELQLWLSRDRRRLPLKLTTSTPLGDLSVELTRATAAR